ncbi:MAG TPA: hypothetical protein VJ180_06485 [Pyrinomonadaceae bacterium]|nr:hypothetical protein [Pyrinomonadaceae bacterium]
MYTTPIILPLDANGSIYALLDEQGCTIGTGSRSVCEVLLYMITKAGSRSPDRNKPAESMARPNLRSAIPI